MLRMVGDVIIFVLRICLVAVIAAFFWRLIEPKTQQARILRAALLVGGLLVTLVVIRSIGA
jgi:peptidoglycan/LPS O-acetylase OafA/YrhL